MQNLIGLDFSIVKPAACVLSNNKYFFYIWSKDLNDKDVKILTDVNVNVKVRHNIEITDKVRYEIINANVLSDSIINSLLPYINKNTLIAFEGASFASKGNMIISLMTWKYMLIYKLSLLISINQIYNYSPLTIKSVAGCASKDKKGKDSMILAFGESKINHKLCDVIRERSHELRKKTNYVSGIDDLADSYWVLKTLEIKENI